MKIRVKNNRLALECKVKNLEKATIPTLQKIARKYQLGIDMIEKKEQRVIKRGEEEMEEKLTYLRKPKSVLINDIRRYLTITLDIPKEYWTDEQRDFFVSNKIEDLDDARMAVDLKKEAGILYELPPFEDGVSDIQTLRLLAELTEEQWEYMKDRYNYKIEIVKDPETDLKTKKKHYRHMLMVHEWIPENKEDEERVEEMKPKKAIKKDAKK